MGYGLRDLGWVCFSTYLHKAELQGWFIRQFFANMNARFLTIVFSWSRVDKTVSHPGI